MTKKTIFYIIFFAVLVTVFLFVLTKIVPGFGNVGLPVLNYVQPFAFTDQRGGQVTQRDLSGKVYVAEYFFTTCKGICPKMNTNMQKVYAAFSQEADFRILSHTVDPEVDDVARLKAYSDSLGVDPTRWIFVTGSKDSLYTAARVSYLLDDPSNTNANIDEQFLHTQFFALVDKQGRVRKIYDGLKRDEINELTNDVRKLLDEG